MLIIMKISLLKIILNLILYLHSKIILFHEKIYLKKTIDEPLENDNK